MKKKTENNTATRDVIGNIIEKLQQDNKTRRVLIILFIFLSGIAQQQSFLFYNNLHFNNQSSVGSTEADCR